MAQAPDITALAGQGVAVVVATRDGDLRPAVSRGWGPQLSGDGAQLTLCIEAPPGSATLANLRSGSPVAVTISRPSSYSSAQLKGRVTELRDLTAGDRTRTEAHLAAFAAEVEPFGIDGAAARLFLVDELVTVTVDVGERFDQTPGVRAGERL
jgi:hypothetical protein